MKTAFITGGNKGIGYAVCAGLAAHGYKIFLGARNAALGRQACETLRNLGHTDIEFIEIDTSNEHSIQIAARKLSSLTDHLDVLVNNAGVYLDQQNTALTIPAKTILDTFTINTLGPLLITRELTTLLKKSPRPQIINLSSQMGQLVDMEGGSAAYRISKTALNAVTRILAAELANEKIYVNAVCPGWVKTDMGGASAPRTPEQGADTVIWLATENSRLTGQFLRDRKQIPW